MGPVFLTDYPAPMAALARLRPEDPGVAERFELYILGLELCNGYGELTDPGEQRRRYEQQRQQRLDAQRSLAPLDEAFLLALSQGMPAAGGNALGVDRLLMLLCEQERIDQVLAFPLAGELSERGPTAEWV
jgi:lysyl-tRNA synthetase class 2